MNNGGSTWRSSLRFKRLMAVGSSVLEYVPSTALSASFTEILGAWGTFSDGVSDEDLPDWIKDDIVESEE